MIIVTLVICIVCYLRFVYRAAKNLDLANARGLTISAPWAVGWSFIPFANIVMIYNVMAEILRFSRDPDKGRFDTPSIFGWWYGMRIIGSIVGSISNVITPKADAGATPEFYSSFAWAMIFAAIASLLAALSSIFLIRIVRQITDSQEALRTATAST